MKYEHVYCFAIDVTERYEKVFKEMRFSMSTVD